MRRWLSSETEAPVDAKGYIDKVVLKVIEELVIEGGEGSIETGAITDNAILSMGYICSNGGSTTLPCWK